MNEPDKRATVEVGPGAVTIKQPGRSSLIVANILGIQGDGPEGPKVIWLDRLVHREAAAGYIGWHARGAVSTILTRD